MGVVLMRLLVISFGYLLPIWLFTQGFLLTRHTIADSTSELSFDRPTLNISKVVLVVIDALRYDFVSRSQLPSIWNIIDQHPHNCLLTKTVADPPTTTLQRLKGITTGSLPTFIDAGANFASGYINEDNLIAQLKSVGKNVTFMGDDTWVSLFPSHFHRRFSFPSFDIKDLDTVDNGILTHLEPELRRNDWQLLIAHFLGVDHCGHRYGPNHVEMSRKLGQMNEVIRNISAAISPDTVMIVIGDHGMTETGDHGGDSDLEVSTTMFLYSQNVQFTGETVKVKPLPQISIVPTLAYLLNIPIPFSNIGLIVTEMFPDAQLLISALKANAYQIFTYLKAYAETTSDLAIVNELNRLTSEYLNLNRSTEADQWELWMNSCRKTLHLFWAKFDNTKMAFGIASFAENLLFTFTQISAVNDFKILLISRVIVSILIAAVCLFGNQSVMLLPIIGGFLALSSISSGFRLVKLLRLGNFLTSESLVIAIVTLLWFSTSFSNSFVVVEDRVAHFLIETILLGISIKLLVEKSQSKKEKTAGKLHTRKSIKQRFSLLDLWSVKYRAFAYLLLTMTIQRLLWIFRRCREEDFSCSLSIFTYNWHSLAASDRFVRFLLSSLSLLLLCLLPKRLLTKNGNLSGKSLFELCQSRLVPVAFVFVAAHWLVDTSMGESDLDAAGMPNPLARQQLVLAWFVYGIVLIGLIAFIISPACVTTVIDDSHRHRTADLVKVVNSREELREKVPVLFNLLRKNWNVIDINSDQSESQIFVFGLATGYSSSIVALLSLVIVTLVFLLGDGLAPGLFSLILSGALLLEVQNIAELSPVSLCGLWYLLSCRYFYSLGHQPTFPTIPWSAAFVGLPGNFPYPAGPALLVLFNLYSAQIICAFSLPLLHFWSKYAGKTGSLSAVKCVEAKEPGKTEATLIGTDVPRDVAQLLLVYIAFSGVKVLGTLLTSAHLRRHLMVWKIFGPKFVFEAVGFTITSVTLLFALIAVCRIHAKITKEFGTVKIHQDVSRSD